MVICRTLGTRLHGSRAFRGKDEINQQALNSPAPRRGANPEVEPALSESALKVVNLVTQMIAKADNAATTARRNLRTTAHVAKGRAAPVGLAAKRVACSLGSSTSKFASSAGAGVSGLARQTSTCASRAVRVCRERVAHVAKPAASLMESMRAQTQAALGDAAEEVGKHAGFAAAVLAELAEVAARHVWSARIQMARALAGEAVIIKQ